MEMINKISRANWISNFLPISNSLVLQNHEVVSSGCGKKNIFADHTNYTFIPCFSLPVTKNKCAEEIVCLNLSHVVSKKKLSFIGDSKLT